MLIPILIGWYLILALGHYFDQRPLWNDELCVLNNIIHLKPTALFTQPLLSDQDFPRVYLWIIQQFAKYFNQSVLALRLFSLMAMLGAFFVWLKIAQKLFIRSWELILFIACWGASMPLIYYAAELKPYSMDVFGSGLIVLFLINQDRIQKRLRVYRIMVIFLPFFGLLSYPFIFLLLLPLYNLIRDSIDQRRWLLELSFFLASCSLTLGLVYLIDFRVTVPHLMAVFWHDYFISLHSFKDFFETLGKGLNNLIARRFAESPRWVKGPSRIFIGLGVAYMVTGFWRQFNKDRYLLRSMVPIASAMFILQLVLAILWIYPFSVPRLSLFFSPMLFMMTVSAMSSLRIRNKALGAILQMIFAGYLVFVSLGIACDVFIKRDLGAESRLFSIR